MQPLTLAAFAGSMWRKSFKTSKPSKNVHSKLSGASCDTIQVFFTMSLAQYVQNTSISAAKVSGSLFLKICLPLNNAGRKKIYSAVQDIEG